MAAEHGCAKIEDLYADLGYGKFSARQVLSKATGQTFGEKHERPGEKGPHAAPKRAGEEKEHAVTVRGHGDLMVFLAKCCSPIPGEDIIGYVTRGRGVAVHCTSCPNVQNLLYQSERRIAVEWGKDDAAQYSVTLLIRSQDRPGLLADVTAVISGESCNIKALDSRPDNLNARVEATLELTDRKQLERILANIKKDPGVYGVERVYRV